MSDRNNKPESKDSAIKRNGIGIKKFKESEWRRWLLYFSLAVAVIFVYKSFGTISEVFSWIGKLWQILVPFITAFAIAYFLNRPVSLLERLFKKIKNPKLKFFHKIARYLSIGIVYIIFIGLLALLIYAIVPELVSGLLSLWNNASGYFDTASEFLRNLETNYPMLAGFDLGRRLLEWAENLITSFDMNTLIGTVQSVTGVGSTVVNIVLSIFVSIYMISEREKLIAALRRICSLFMQEKTLNAVGNYLVRADKVVYTYFTAQFLDCVLISIFATIVLAILGAPSPLVLGFIFGMMNIIPYFGPIIGGVAVVFVILVTRGFMTALWATIILLVLQQIDANIVNPRILGNSLDMSPFWVIFSITLFGGMFGFGGMLLGVPIAAVLRMIYRDMLVYKKRVARADAIAEASAEAAAAEKKSE